MPPVISGPLQLDIIRPKLAGISGAEHIDVQVHVRCKPLYKDVTDGAPSPVPVLLRHDKEGSIHKEYRRKKEIKHKKHKLQQ